MMERSVLAALEPEPTDMDADSCIRSLNANLCEKSTGQFVNFGCHEEDTLDAVCE